MASEAGKCKEIDSPPEPPERNTAQPMSWSEPSETHVRLDVQDYKIMCCIKPLSLWQTVTATVGTNATGSQ